MSTYMEGNLQYILTNNPLTYVLTSTKLDATGQRWIAALANYNFSLHYRLGKTNVEADALSRIPNVEGEMSIDQDVCDKSYCKCNANRRI